MGPLLVVGSLVISNGANGKVARLRVVENKSANRGLRLHHERFRGINPVREAMHSAFLYHAQKGGLDVCIVNAGMLDVYDDIPKERLELVEDVLLNRREDATERLTDYAHRIAAQKEQKHEQSAADAAVWREWSVQRRLAHARSH